MSEHTTRRKALILSPTASHPQDQGNRNRVFRTCSYLKEIGFDIHFLLYPMEREWESEFLECSDRMRTEWSSFAIIPPSRPLHQLAVGKHHSIDEWWDLQIETHLKWLFAREWFDLFLVNYTFFSKAFEFAPSSTVKVLETHDMFAGRKELFEANEAPLEFFYTTSSEEAVALKRADVAIAIKDEEAESLQKIAATSEVISVPFFSAAGVLPPRPERLEPGRELRVGFIGALNSVNVLNMQRFLDKFEQYRTIYMPPPIIFVIAGNVCEKLRSSSPRVSLLGRIEDIDDFYRDVDVVVAPMAFSTGIKIKVGEALAYGRPVVATGNGFGGFPALDRFHSLDNINQVCRALISLAFDRNRLLDLERHSAVSAELAKCRSEDGYAALKRAVARRSKRIVFITDEMIWQNRSFRQARLAQWCDFCVHLARTAIFYVGPKQSTNMRPNKPLNRRTEFCALPPDLDEIVQAVEALCQSYFVIEVVVAVGGKLGEELWNKLKSRMQHVTLDAWTPRVENGAHLLAAERSDIWVSAERDGDPTGSASFGRPLSTTALRYPPPGFERSRGVRSNPPILIARCGCDKLDQIGVELLLHDTRLSGRAVVDIEIAYDDQSGSSFAKLQKLDKPEVLLAVGPDRRAAEIARCLATFWGAKFIWVSAGRFPIYVGDSGTPDLCWSFEDVGQYLSELPRQIPSATEHSADCGWSSYWRLVSQRKNPQSAPVAENRRALSGILQAS